MVIEHERTLLDDALNDGTTTVFLLLGAEDSKAGAVHTDMEEQEWQPWQKYFLITAASILKSEERSGWFANEDTYYAVLGGDGNPKTVAVNGPIKELLVPQTSNGAPDRLKINAKMALGDQTGGDAL